MWFMSGLLTWGIGRGVYHVGASGLVFALLFFLFFSGLLRKYIPLVAVSLVVAFIYGSTIWSIFPFTEWIDATISWEGISLALSLAPSLLLFIAIRGHKNHFPSGKRKRLMLKLVPSLKVVAMVATIPITRSVRNRSTVDGAPLLEAPTQRCRPFALSITYPRLVSQNRSLKIASLFKEVAILIKWRALSLLYVT